MKNRPVSSLVVSLGKALKGDAPTFMWKAGGPVFPPKRGLVAGRASDCKNKMSCNDNADQKLSALATPRGKKAERQQQQITRLKPILCFSKKLLTENIFA